MDYERKYKEAVNKIKNLLDDGEKNGFTIVTYKTDLESIFPELKESEDERIRKEIITLIQSCDKGCYTTISPSRIKEYTAWLEKQEEQKEINLVEILKHYPKETELYSPLYGKLWLAEVDEKNEIITCYKHHLEEGCTRAVLEQEDTVSFYSNGTTGLPDFNVSKDCMLFLYDITKQGEQKPADKVEPKFKVGEWIVYYRNDFSREILYVYDIRDGRYYFNDNIHFSWSVKECDEKSHLWTISDAMAGDVLFHSDSASNGIFIFKELLKCGFSEKVICYCDYDSEDGFCLGEHHTCCWSDAKILHPATKEQCDILFSKIKEAGYEWDAENLQLTKILHVKELSDGINIDKQKLAEWSEEDKKLTDVNHEYFSKLLENNNSENINDYAYQVAYCMSHDWIEETATWDDVQKACKLGAEWNEKYHNKSAWCKEDDELITAAICFIDSYNHDNGFACNGIHKGDVSKWILSLKQRIGG